MTPQEELERFYSSLKSRAPANLADYSDLRGPDLIWLDDEYLNSTPRMAVVGQQQLWWKYSYPEFISQRSISDAIAVYRKFDFGVGENYYASPFWRFFDAVRTAAFPDDTGTRRRVLWTNLVKFVANDMSSILWKPYAKTALSLQEDVLISELTIARPDICLFVTGPRYDSVLERYFHDVRFESLDLPVRQFARLVHTRLPQHSYRTYHPAYLNRINRWEKVLQILARELSWPNKITGPNAGGPR